MSGEDSLARHARRAMEEAYSQRPRPKASREDFGAGWIACAKYLRSASSFAAGTDLNAIEPWPQQDAGATG